MCWFKKKKKTTDVVNASKKEKSNDKVITLDAKEPFVIARSKTKMLCGVDMVNNYTACPEPDAEGYYLVVRTGEINLTWGYKWEKFRANGYAKIFRKHQNDQVYNDRIPDHWRKTYKEGVEIAYLYESIYDPTPNIEKYIGFSEEIRKAIIEKYLGKIDKANTTNEEILKKSIEALAENPELSNELKGYGVENIEISVKQISKVEK